MPISKNKQIEGSDTEHYISPRKQRPEKQATGQPPLTPMIDVTFQLLLYFILTSTFQPDEGQIPGTLPSITGPTDSEPPPREVRISIEQGDINGLTATYQVGGNAPIPTNGTSEKAKKDAAKKLIAEVLNARQQRPGEKVPVVINPQGDVRWEFITEAFNAAIKARFKKIGFAAGQM